jgi:surface antigen
MRLPRSSQPLSHRLRRAIGGSVVLALIAGAAATSTARAETLDEKQQRLEQALQTSKASLQNSKDEAASTQDDLTTSQTRLSRQQQLLSQATADVTAAKAQDQLLGTRLKSAQTALAKADKDVADGKARLDKERKRYTTSMNRLVQQSSPLQGLALITTNTDAATMAQRAQWSRVAVNVSHDQVDKVSHLVTTLQTAQKTQAAATKQAAERKKESADHLRTTTSIESEASDAADAVAATVALNTAAAENAKAQLEADQNATATIQGQIDTTVKQIAQAKAEAERKAAEERAAKIAAAKAKAAAERKAAQERAAKAAAAQKAAAARAAKLEAQKAAQEKARQAAAKRTAAQKSAAKAAAARAAAKERAARQKAKAASNRAAKAAAAAERRKNTSSSKKSSSSAKRSSYTAGSYSAVANYNGVDPWGFYWGQCVSYAAWKVRTTTSWSNFQNYTNGVHFGNAVNWGYAARQIGVRVDTHPSVGSVAWRTSGSAGHVAWVTAVHSDGTIDVSEYNYLVSSGFDTRSHVDWSAGGSQGFVGFIHF